MAPAMVAILEEGVAHQKRGTPGLVCWIGRGVGPWAVNGATKLFLSLFQMPCASDWFARNEPGWQSRPGWSRSRASDGTVARKLNPFV
jgi:hypothetical protein